MRVYYDRDCDINLIKDKKVAILGYGSQGHAHALNLKESGVNVVVGLRPDSASVAKATADGLEVLAPLDATKKADMVMILVPDEIMGDVYSAEIADGLEPGNMLLFAHGFAVHFKQIAPPAGVDVAMVAPKGPGHLVRRQVALADPREDGGEHREPADPEGVANPDGQPQLQHLRRDLGVPHGPV